MYTFSKGKKFTSFISNNKIITRIFVSINGAVMENPEKNKQPKSTVASFVIDEELHRRMKIYAASSGKKIKDVLNEALTEYLEERESL